MRLTKSFPLNDGRKISRKILRGLRLIRPE